MGVGLADEEYSYRFNSSITAGYEAGAKYSYYSKLIRKEAV